MRRGIVFRKKTTPQYSSWQNVAFDMLMDDVRASMKPAHAKYLESESTLDCLGVS